MQLHAEAPVRPAEGRDTPPVAFMSSVIGLRITDETCLTTDGFVDHAPAAGQASTGRALRGRLLDEALCRCFPGLPLSGTAGWLWGESRRTDTGLTVAVIGPDMEAGQRAAG